MFTQAQYLTHANAAHTSEASTRLPSQKVRVLSPEEETDYPTSLVASSVKPAKPGRDEQTKDTLKASIEAKAKTPEDEELANIMKEKQKELNGCLAALKEVDDRLVQSSHMCTVLLRPVDAGIDSGPSDDKSESPKPIRFEAQGVHVQGGQEVLPETLPSLAGAPTDTLEVSGVQVSDAVPPEASTSVTGNIAIS